MVNKEKILNAIAAFMKMLMGKGRSRTRVKNH